MSSKRVVFKKVSREKSLTVYLAKRDFVDHCDYVDPVEGVLVIDPQQLKGKKARDSEAGDLVFEEFKRDYLKGVIRDDDDSATEA